MEEEESHGDAFHKFQAIEKKAVKAIFSSKVGKESLVVLNLSISVLDDFDQWTLVVFSFPFTRRSEVMLVTGWLTHSLVGDDTLPIEDLTDEEDVEDEEDIKWWKLSSDKS